MKPFATPEVAAWMPTASASSKAVFPKTNPVNALLHRFTPIFLEQMRGMELLSRIDTKYLIPQTQLPSLLMALSSHYRILEIGGTRLQAYRTLYFDTPDFLLYQRHHAGGRNRYKVRSRTYLDSDLSFLEVKRKTNKKQTIKSRVPTAQLATEFTAEEVAFLTAHFPMDPADLEAKLYNDYSRISLVSKSQPERLTLDLDLRFQYGSDSADLPGILIAELKQQSHQQLSVFTQLMRDLHLRPGSFSKYTMGATLIYPHLKQNRFKKEHHRIAKLQEGAFRDYL